MYNLLISRIINGIKKESLLDRIYFLMFEVKQDSLGDVILLTSQGVSFTEVQEGMFSR